MHTDPLQISRNNNHPITQAQAISFLTGKQYLFFRDLYQDFIDQAASLLGAGIAYFNLMDPDSEPVLFWSTSIINQGPCTFGDLFSFEQSAVWTDALRAGNFRVRTHHLAKGKTDSDNRQFNAHLCVVLENPRHRKIKGILGMGRKLDPFTPDELQVLEHFIREAWPLVLEIVQKIKMARHESTRLFTSNNPRDSLASMIAAIARAIEIKDFYTSFHQNKVAVISGKIASALGYDEEQMFGLKICAGVHDIGKMGIPLEILNKPGTLTSTEYSIIKTHPDIGADILKSVITPWDISRNIAQHHEKLDGSGYPSGLTLGAISEEARIIAVADIIDAMGSDRPYREAIGLESAFSILDDNRGTLYDPYVVEAASRLFEEDSELTRLYGNRNQETGFDSAGQQDARNAG